MIYMLLTVVIMALSKPISAEDKASLIGDSIGCSRDSKNIAHDHYTAAY
jgi:hypothetical protein